MSLSGVGREMKAAHGMTRNLELTTYLAMDKFSGLLEEKPFDAPGTQDSIFGGTDNNGHEVRDTVKITLIERGG